MYGRLRLSSSSSSRGLTFRQTEIQADAGLVSILEGEYGMRLGKRTRIRGSLLYPTFAYSADITSAVGDGFLRGTLRIAGDTLNIDGIYMRFDAQIPIGPASMTPYSFRSLDVGLGLEYRKHFPMLEIRGAATYTLVGEKQKMEDLSAGPQTRQGNDPVFIKGA